MSMTPRNESPGRWAAMAKRTLREVFYTAVVSAVIIIALQYADKWRIRTAAADLGQASSAVVKRREILPAAQLTIRGSVPIKNSYAILLVVSPTCGFCVRSESFHRSLAAEAERRLIRAVVAVPRVKEAGGYLSSLNLKSAKTVNWHDLNLTAPGTPYIALIDPAGVVRMVWMGQLGKPEEQSVLDSLRDPSHLKEMARSLGSGEQMLTVKRLRELEDSQRVTLISIVDRDAFARDHLEGAINLPAEELQLRAPIELKRDWLQVIDCTTVPVAECSQEIGTLRKQGFLAGALDASYAGDKQGSIRRIGKNAL